MLKFLPLQRKFYSPKRYSYSPRYRYTHYIRELSCFVVADAVAGFVIPYCGVDSGGQCIRIYVIGYHVRSEKIESFSVASVSVNIYRVGYTLLPDYNRINSVQLRF